MKHKIFNLLFITVLSLAIVAGIVACSPRDEAITDPEIVPGTEVDIIDQVVTSEDISSDESAELIGDAMNNYRELHTPPEDPEWYVIDLELTFDYEYFWLDENEKEDTSSSFELDFKANMNLKDNDESQVFIQLRNSGGTPIFGLYYVENYAYFVIGSNRYYAREINFGQLGMLIYEGLGSLEETSGIKLDIFGILAGLPTGNTGISQIDGIMELAGSSLLFNSRDITLNSSNIDEEGIFNTQTISTALKLNTLLELLSNPAGLGIEGFIGLPPIWFGGIWDLVGLDLDPVLNQFFGFTLEQLATKEWPDMDARYNVITDRQLITRVDSDGFEESTYEYVATGWSLTIDTLLRSLRSEQRAGGMNAVRETWGNVEPSEFVPTEDLDHVEEYSVEIALSPMMYASDEPIGINFANLNANEDGRGSVYSSGGLGNLGLEATLSIEAQNGQITLNDILGDFLAVDLGALGEMPIQFSGFTPGNDFYDFGISLNLGLDFFDGMETNAEATISYNSKPLIRVYLDDNTLYLNFDGLRLPNGTAEGQEILPKIRIPGFDVNELLDGLFLDMIKPFLDPDATPVAGILGGSESAAANAEGDDATTGTSIDVMALLGTILDNFEFPGRGEYVEDRDGNLVLDENGQPIPNNFDIYLNLDSQELGDLLASFGLETNPGGQLGSGLAVQLYFNQYNVIDTLSLSVNVTEDVGLGLSIDRLSYLREPDWQNDEMVQGHINEYVNLGLTLTDGILSIVDPYFELNLSGEVELGLGDTTGGANDNGNHGLDLSALIGTFVENLALFVGVDLNGQDEIKGTVGYSVFGYIDLMHLDEIELNVNLYMNENTNYLARIFYEGESDSLFLDLSNLANALGVELNENGGFLAELPRLVIPDLGLADMLSSVSIVDILAGILTTGGSAASAPQNAPAAGQNYSGINIDFSDGNFGFTGVYEYLLNLGFLSLFPNGAEINPWNDDFVDILAGALNAEGDGTDTGTDTGTDGSAPSIDILALIGSALGSVQLDKALGTLTVVVASDVLTSVVGMLLAGFPAGGTLPEVEAYIRLHLDNLDFENIEDSVFTIYLAMLAPGENDEAVRAISLKLDLLKSLSLRKGSENGTVWTDSDGNYKSTFQDMQDFLDGLKVGINIGGSLSFDSDQDIYENEFLNGLLSGLISGLGLRLDVTELDIDLGLRIVGTLSLGGLIKLDGSAGADPIQTLLSGSEAMISLYDMNTRDAQGNYVSVLGIYLYQGNLYLDLSYFGIPKIGITDVSQLITDITELTASPTPAAPENAEAIANDSEWNLLNIDNTAKFANTANPLAIALQAVIGTDAVTVNVTKDIIAALLGMLLNTELPIEIQDTELSINYGGGNLGLTIGTGIDCFNLGVELGDVALAVGSGDSGENWDAFTFTAPNDDGSYNMSGGGLPTNISFGLEAELGIFAEDASIDLTPALSGLLGDITLNVLIEALGLVDESLTLSVSGILNLEELIDIATNGFDFANIKKTQVALKILTGEDQPVLEVYFVNGDLYLNLQTAPVTLDHVLIENANEFIGELIGSLTGGAEAGDVSNAPMLSEGDVTADEIVYAYITLVLADGGLSVTLTKDFLIGLLASLGVDLGSYLDSLDFNLNLSAGLSPLEINLGIDIKDTSAEGSGEITENAITLHATIGGLTLGVDTPDIEVPDLGAYNAIESLQTIAVELTGEITAEITADNQGPDEDTGFEGGYYHAFIDVFDEIAKTLDQSAEKDKLVWISQQMLTEEWQQYRIENGMSLEDLQAHLSSLYDEEVAPMSYEALLNVALVLEVLDNYANETATFGGTLYYKIKAILDITDIMNLKVALFINDSSDPNGNGNVLSVSLMGVLDEETGEYDLNLFVDLTNVLKDGIVIEDKIRISNFDEFSAYMASFAEKFTGKEPTNAPVAAESENNGLELPKNEEGEIADSVMTGAAFVLAITEYAKEHGIPNGAPVSIVAPSAAIYSVIGSLLDSVLTSDYEMPIDVDKEQVRIQNFLANNYYNAEEIYYAVRGAIGMLTAELQAIGGDDATAIVNLISTFIDGDGGLRDEFTDDDAVKFDAAQLESYFGDAGSITAAIAKAGIKVSTDVWAIYEDAAAHNSADTAVAAEDIETATALLWAGIKEEIASEYHDQVEAGEMTERDWQYLVNGMIGKLDGSSFGNVPGNPTYVDPNEYPDIDISKFFGPYMPSGLIQIGASEVPNTDGTEGTHTAFFLLNLSIEQVLNVQMELGKITVDLSPEEDPYFVGETDPETGVVTGGLLNSGYYHLDPAAMDDHNIILSLDTVITFDAEDTVLGETAIDLSEVVGAIFSEVLGADVNNFGAIIENAGYSAKNVGLSLDVRIGLGDIMGLLAGDEIYGLLVNSDLSLELSFNSLKDGGDPAIISLYYTDGTAYIDGSVIGVEKISVEQALGRLLEMFGIDISGYYENMREADGVYNAAAPQNSAPAGTGVVTGNAPDNAEGDTSGEVTGAEMIPYLHLMLGNEYGVVLDFLGPLIFGLLSGLQVDVGGTDLGQLVENTVNGDLDLQLGIMAKLGLLEEVYNRYDQDLSSSAVALAIEVGNYTLGLAIDTLAVDLDDSYGATSILPPTFDAQDYATTDNLETVYVKFELGFDISGDANTQFGLDETLSALLTQLGGNSTNPDDAMNVIKGLGLAPVISLLSQLSNSYILEFEGNINLAEIIDYQTFYKSKFSIVLRDANEKAIYDGVEKYKEVFSGHYFGDDSYSSENPGGSLYLNFECFNIQAVRIDNFYQFLMGLLRSYGIDLGGTEEGTAGTEGTEGAESGTEPQNSGFAGYVSPDGFDPFLALRNMPEGSSNLATYLNLLLCPDGFFLGIGTAAIFAILTAIGGEAMDFSSYVEPIGEIGVEVGLLGPEKLLGLGLSFQAYEYLGDERVVDENGNYVLSDNSIDLELSFSSDISLAFTYQFPYEEGMDWTPDENGVVHLEMSPPEHAYMQDGSTKDYVVFDTTNPVIGLETKLYFDIAAGKVTGTGTTGGITGDRIEGYELFREPLISLLAGVLDVSLSVLLEVMEDQEFSLEVELLANLPIRSLRGISAQLTIRRVDHNHNYIIARVNLYSSDLYIDLSQLNGPRFMIEEIVETILGEKDFDLGPLEGLFGSGETDSPTTPTTGDGAPSNAPGTGYADGPSTPVDLFLGMFMEELSTYGLALALTETTATALLGALDMGSFDIFSDLLVQVFLAPNKDTFRLGVDIEAGANYTDPSDNSEHTSTVLDLGLGLDGLGIQFEGYDANELLIPPSTNYTRAHDINTVMLDASFQLSFNTEDGGINLHELYMTLFDANGDLANIEGIKESVFSFLFEENNPLVSELPQLIMLGDIGDTLTIDVTGYVYIASGVEGLLDRLQLKIVISTNAPQFSKENGKHLMAFYYHDSDLYADFSPIGMGKVSAPEVPNVINFLINGRPEDGTTATPENTEARFIEQYPTWAAAMGLNNATETEKIQGIAKILLGNDDGLMITVTIEMLSAILSMLAVDIDIGKYFRDVIDPSASVGMTPDSEYQVGIYLDSAAKEWAVYDNDGKPVLDENGQVTTKPNNAGMALGISILGQSMKVNVKNVHTAVSEEMGEASTLDPVISIEDRKAYTYFAQIALTTGTNIRLTIDLQDGNLDVTDLLDIVFGMLGLKAPEGFNTSIDFTGGDESLICELSVDIGVDLNRLLYAQDAAEIARALTVDLVIGYTVMDNTGDTPTEYMSQDLIRVALADNVAYAGVELFDSQLFLSLHDLDLNTTIRSIMEKIFVIPELDDDTEIGGNSGNAGNADEGSGTAPMNAPVSGTNPIIDMYLDQITSVGDFMQPLIYLNSQGFALMVTNELLIEFIKALREIINDAVGSTEDDVLTDENITGIVTELLDYMSLGIYFDEDKGGNLSIDIGVSNESVEEDVGNGGVIDSVGYDVKS